ncbi:MAG: VCBS repeat-containing protein, partial [Acidobacteria bacterium]
MRTARRVVAIALVAGAALLVPGDASADDGTLLAIHERGGRLETWTALEGSGRAGRCGVLVEQTASPRRWALSLVCRDGDEPTVRPLEEIAASRAPALGADHDTGGRPLLLLGLPGGRIVARRVDIDSGSLGPPSVLLDEPSLGRAELADRTDVDGDGTDDLVVATPDGLAVWRRHATGFSRLGAVTLPRRAALSVLGPQAIVRGPAYDRRADAAPRVRWMRPEPRPGSRLAVRRVSLAAGAAIATCEAWIRTDEAVFVGPMRVVAGPDGPLLFGLTLPTGRVSVLGKWSILLAPLVCDRTARGIAPLATGRTPIPIWSSTRFAARADFDGDGTVDLGIQGVSGRRRPQAELLLYDGAALRRGTLPQPTTFSVAMKRAPRGPWLNWEADLDDDGLPELVYTPRQGAVAVIPSRRAEGGAFPLERKSGAERALPEGALLTAPPAALRLRNGGDIVLLR